MVGHSWRILSRKRNRDVLPCRPIFPRALRLKRANSTHRFNTWNPSQRDHTLKLITRSEFAEKVFVIAYKWRYLLVAFNFPFDISRIAYQHGIARGPKRKRYDGKLERRRNSLSGGFSFHLCSYLDSENQERHDHYRPSISIKKIDSKRAIKAFTSRHDPDPTDLISEDSESGNGEAKPFRGNFLDARTLAFALFDQSY